MNIPKIQPAALALALGLMASHAIAQDAPSAAQQKELDDARADLDKAAKRFAELQRKYGDVAPGAPVFHIEKRLLRKPVIGVLLAPDEQSGVRIVGVTPDSAAAAGGLKSGDRIVSIDGKPLAAADGAARVEEVRELLGATDEKTPVKLGFERDGKTRVVSLTPKTGDRLLVVPGLDSATGNVKVFKLGDGQMEVLADGLRIDTAMTAEQARKIAADAKRRAQWAVATAPDLRSEIIRLHGDCKGDDCKLPALAEAFRWSGLNLASLEGGLGRYFGSDQGVLLLSTGNDLEGLQVGDVILKIAGKPVNNPREAMDALRAQPAEGKVAVDYLRDRKPGSAQVSVPKLSSFHFPASTWTSKGAMQDGKRKYVVIDKDGQRREWEGDAGDTPPAWVQALPQPEDGKRIEKRLKVIVDDHGNKSVVEDDGPASKAD